MKTLKTVSHLAFSGAICALVAFSLAGSVSAATIEIQFTGMNLSYDGSAIYDGASPNTTGVANPADADKLTFVDFVVDGSSVGTLSSDVSLDVYIPDVTGIPSAAGTSHNLTTPGNPGFFDLLIGTAPLASQFLILDLNSVNVTYVDVANIVQFTFGAALADLVTQNLPFGLVIDDPVTVSFSAQIVPGTRTVAGNVVNGFAAAGTGEIQGSFIPEPTSCMLAIFGFVSALAIRRN